MIKSSLGIECLKSGYVVCTQLHTVHRFFLLVNKKYHVCLGEKKKFSYLQFVYIIYELLQFLLLMIIQLYGIARESHEKYSCWWPELHKIKESKLQGEIMFWQNCHFLYQRISTQKYMKSCVARKIFPNALFIILRSHLFQYIE